MVALGVAAAALLLVTRAGAAPDDTSAWLLSIRSDSACPPAALVDRRTRELLGLAAEVALKESVELAHEGTGLSVRLRGEDQRLLGERVLPLEEDCDALARAAAVVLASWLTDAHPEFLAPKAASPEVAPEPPRSPVAPPAPTRLVARVAARGEVRVADELRLRPFVGFGVIAGAAGAAPAAVVGATLAPNGSGLGFTARLGLATKRSMPLGAGELELLRFPVAAGAVVRLESGRLAGELHGGAAAAWLRLEGEGFTRDRTVNDLAFGLLGALRGSVGFGVVEPFLELSAYGWPGAGTAFVDPPDPGVSLPRGELFGVAGAVFRP